jgi:hypothetical protein
MLSIQYQEGTEAAQLGLWPLMLDYFLQRTYQETRLSSQTLRAAQSAVICTLLPFRAPLYLPSFQKGSQTCAPSCEHQNSIWS